MRKFLQLLFAALLFSFTVQPINSPTYGKSSGVFGRSDKDKNDSPGKENNEVDIDYSIEPFYDVNAFRLIVVLEFNGEKSGETKILLPGNPSSGIKQPAIKYLKALSIGTSIEDTENPSIKLVKYPSNSLVRIYYQIGEGQNDNAKSSNYYEAVIRTNFFHFFSDMFFIIPQWDWGNVYNFRISWNHMPSNWRFANSFGIDQNQQYFNCALWKFRDAVFAGGDFKIYNRTTKAGKLYFAIRGKWEFQEEHLCDITKTIFSEENNFWNDNSNPFELEIVLPFENSETPIAENRTNAISLFLSPDEQIDYTLKTTIAYEYFHKWIGIGIQFADPQQLVFWFKEGICQYYGSLFLLRAGLIKLDEYVKQYNNLLEEYYTSSVRFETNENASKKFWSDPNFNRLTIQRGDIIANNLNAAIMKNANGAKSLDDFVRDLYKRCRTESLVISNGSLGALIRFYAGDGALSEIMRTLNSGMLPKANTSALGPCFYPEINYKRKFWLIGEKYEIPSYKPKNENQSLDTNCMWWFGTN